MSFGFDTVRLLVWIGVRQPQDDDPMQSGSLCRRHADAMVVPQGWTLDDRREPEPKLFRDARSGSTTATTMTTTATKAKARRRRTTAKTPVTAATVATVDQPALDDVRTVADVAGPMSDPDSTAQLPWWPAFDEADDLDGVLAADTPLLARAFRGADRPR